MAVAALWGCEKTPADNPKPQTPPQQQLPSGSNWVLVGNDAETGHVTRLRSAIYKVEADGTYTFYFSEDSGLTTDGAMLASNTLLTVSGVTNPEAGVQEEASVTFVSPLDTVSSESYESVEVELTLENDNCTLNVTLDNGGTDKLLAVYEGSCPETGFPELGEKAVAVNKEQPTTIGSVVEVRNEDSGIYTYYLYNEENVTKHADATALFTLSVPKAYIEGAVAYESIKPEFEQDFAKGLVEGTEVVFDALPADYKTGANGTLYAGFVDSNTGELKRKLAMTYTKGDLTVRMAYTGVVTCEYGSDDTYTANGVTSPFGTLFTYYDANLHKLFFAFGNYDGTTLQGLHRDDEEGAWAVQFSIVSGPDDGGQYDTTPGLLSNALTDVKAYNYEKRTTTLADNAKLLYYPDGANLYIHFEGSFNGNEYKAEYYGPSVAATLGDEETFESVLTPVKAGPVSSFYLYTQGSEHAWNIQNEFTPLTNEFNETKIANIYVSKRNGALQGIPVGNGSYYSFYIEFEGHENTVDDRNYTPILQIPDTHLGTKFATNVIPEERNYWWYEHRNSSVVSTMYYGYMPAQLSWQDPTNYLTKNGYIEVTQNADKTFTINICIRDNRLTDNSGSGRTFMIKVENKKALLYKGKDSYYNVLTEDDL